MSELGIGSGQQLSPWSLIVALTFELESDDIVEIVSLAGMPVDWSLNSQEKYSHRTRKRAYRPRVDAAFALLNGQEKLRAMWVITDELLRCYPDKESSLRERLAAIGWTLDGGAIRPADSNVSELFFPSGSQHDAYIRIRETIASARNSATIIDPYVDSSLLILLSTCPNLRELHVLTHNLSSDFAQELTKFRAQYASMTIEVRRTKEFHDRFIVIDDQQCFHVGTSIKDAGLRVFMISQIQDPTNVRALLTQVAASWARSQVI